MAKLKVNPDHLAILNVKINATAEGTNAGQIAFIEEKIGCVCMDDNKFWKIRDYMAEGEEIAPVPILPFSGKGINFIDQIPLVNPVFNVPEINLDIRYGKGSIKATGTDCKENKKMELGKGTYLKEKFFNKYQTFGPWSSTCYQSNNRLFIF